jgi:hypothetical protein
MCVTFQNGLFERLISFMDFENAALALIDDEQKDAVHSLFNKLCEMYEAMISKYLEILNLDGVIFHDDWGSQRAPFFSLDVCMEMVVPYLKRIADFCHSKGLWFQQHCCGKNELLVPAMIAARSGHVVSPIHEQLLTCSAKDTAIKIMFSISPPMIAKDAIEEEIEAAAKAFVDKYAPDFQEKPFVMFSFMTPPKFNQAVYRYSRVALSK